MPAPLSLRIKERCPARRFEGLSQQVAADAVWISVRSAQRIALGSALQRAHRTPLQPLQIRVTGGTASDTFNIGDLTGRSVTYVSADFGVDTVADKLNVEATANNDSIIVAGLVDAKVTGLPWDVTAINAKMNGNLIVDGVAVNGGLGDAVAQVLSKSSPAPQEFVAVNDTFGESGTPNELLKKYHLETTDIVLAAERVLTRKN